MGMMSESAIVNFVNIVMSIFLLMLIFTIFYLIYNLTNAAKIIYSTTNNLFVTITIMAAIIFFSIAVIATRNLNKDDKNKGFLENGGIYYIISGVLFIISFIIYLLTKRYTTSKIQINNRR